MPSSTRAWVARLWPAAAFQCAFLAAVTVLKPSANALVVARFHAQALPFLYVASAALIVTVSLGAMVLSRRKGREPMVLALVGAAIALGILVALKVGFSSAALAYYLFAESFPTVVSIVFWNSMSDAFDARESRRAFTAVSGFGMVGAILGGFIAEHLAHVAGTLPLVAAAAGLLGLGALMFRFHTVKAAHAPPRALPHGGGRGDVWAFLRSRPYPLLLGALILAYSIMVPLADFIFRERAARTLGEDALAELFGRQQLWIGLVCAAFQLFVAERLLERLGLLRYLAIIPLMLLPFTIAVVVSQDMWPAFVLKVVESAAILSILPVGVQLLYAPIPDEVRDRIRTLVDGLVKKGGMALGGLLLVGAGPLATGAAPGLALLLLCLLSGVMLWRLRPAYVAALQERVGDGPTPSGSLDEASVKLLAATLASPEPDRVLHALALLEQSGANLRPHVSALLAHPSERVVERGVQIAVSQGAEETTPDLERLLGSDLRRPRVEAVWALAHLAPGRAREVLPALLTHPDPGVRCAAIGALLHIGAPGVDVEGALKALTARGSRAPLAERREVTRLLGRLAEPRFADELVPYLQDIDSSVRNLAIKAVGEGRYVALAGEVLPCLMIRDVRPSARAALASLGDAVVPLLDEALNDRSRPGALRYELPRVFREIGTQAAFDSLLFSNVRDDAFLHYRIGVALCRLKEDRPHLVADKARVHDAIARRRELYRRLVGPYRDLRAALGEESLLTRAMGDRLDQAFEICFWLLGLLHPPRSLRRIHQHLVGEDARRRAYALELLENLVDSEEMELVSEQIHAHHRELPPGAPGRLSEHLGFLCHSDDHVLRACAREVARRVGLWTLPPMEDDMSDATVKRMFALQGVEIFTECDVDDIAAVAQVAREHRFRAGERIFAEGDPGDALYVIVRGTVDAYRKGEKVLTLHSKEAFGDVSLLDGAPRPTENVAREDTTVLVIDRRDFLDLVSDRPELLKGIFRVLSRQLREVVDLAATVRKETGDLSVKSDAG